VEKITGSYNYAPDGMLTVTVTLAEYRDLVECKARRDMDGETINRLKLEIKRLGGTVPVMDWNIDKGCDE
jgi:hypothetical protein